MHSRYAIAEFGYKLLFMNSVEKSNERYKIYVIFVGIKPFGVSME